MDKKNRITTSQSMCSGCGACVQACPQSCISLHADKEGFLYPQIDNTKCIGCNRCEKVCSVQNPVKINAEAQGYAAFSTDENIRKNSSSGGIFSEICKHVINRGGVVFGAAFNDSFEVEHVAVDTISGLQKLQGSKYVQSKIGHCYADAEQYLKSGRLVLFSGTPCQISGLFGYLGKEYDTLITQDFICHGTPSPLAWKKYIEYREKMSSAKTQSVSFRNKKYGWKQYSIFFDFDNHTQYLQDYKNDTFVKAFLSDLCLRPSCYECSCKGIERPSDITLADFWGIDKVMPSVNDNRGCSLVISHSSKADTVLDSIKDCISSYPVDLNSALKWNPAATNSVSKPTNRTRFFRFLNKYDFETAYLKATTSFIARARQKSGNFSAIVSKKVSRKKTIGIITIFDQNNYGNRLQNYASQTFLKSLNVKPISFVESVKRPPQNRKNGTEELKYQIFRLSNFRSSHNPLGWKQYESVRLRKKAFTHFQQKIVTRYLDNLSSLSEYADYFVAGSDQIWQPKWWKNHDRDMFLLSFAKPEQKICLSPSFGTESLASEYADDFRKALSSFSLLTSRENAGAKIIKNLTGKDSVVTIDPTMLLDDVEWRKVSAHPNSKLRKSIF